MAECAPWGRRYPLPGIGHRAPSPGRLDARRVEQGVDRIAETAQMRITIDELALLVREDVAGACEILRLDPLYLANEGRFYRLRSRARNSASVTDSLKPFP